MSKIIKPKVVTLEVIYNAVVGLDSRVGKLEVRFDNLESSMNRRFDEVNKNVDNKIKDLRNYIDDEISDLAGMVQRGFQEQAKMFGLRNSSRRMLA